MSVVLHTQNVEVTNDQDGIDSLEEAVKSSLHVAAGLPAARARIELDVTELVNFNNTREFKMTSPEVFDTQMDEIIGELIDAIENSDPEQKFMATVSIVVDPVSKQ